MRWSAAVAAAVALLAGGVGVAAPASAAVNICNDYYDQQGYIPQYVSGGAGYMDCFQNTSNYTYAATYAIQRTYNACYAAVYGYARIATDGIYGPNTNNAVHNVQIRHGIGGNGSFGPVTNSVIRHLRNSGACSNWSP